MPVIYVNDPAPGFSIENGEFETTIPLVNIPNSDLNGTDNRLDDIKLDFPHETTFRFYDENVQETVIGIDVDEDNVVDFVGSLETHLGEKYLDLTAPVDTTEPIDLSNLNQSQQLGYVYDLCNDINRKNGEILTPEEIDELTNTLANVVIQFGELNSGNFNVVSDLMVTTAANLGGAQFKTFARAALGTFNHIMQ